MASSVSSLPQRPLTKAEVLNMGDRAREYCIRPDSDEAYVISLIGQDSVHALGYTDDTESWVQIHRTDIEYSDEAFEAFEDAIYDWAEGEYGSRIEAGELRMVGPDDPPLEESNPERPQEVEMGLEPEYDCPDCDYYKTGLTTSPHAFLDHLTETHDYTRSEADTILN